MENKETKSQSVPKKALKPYKYNVTNPDLDKGLGLIWVPLLLIRLVLKLLFRVEYVGLENLPDQGPLLLTANHTSLFDVLAIIQKTKFWTHWVSKKELLKFSIARLFFQWVQIIPVDRQKNDIQTAKMMITTLKEGKVIGIFPEATRLPKGADFADYPPKPGAASFAIKNDVPILPVAIEGHFRLFAKVRIIFGEPYKLPASKESIKQDALKHSYEVMKRIYALMGICYPDAPAELETGEV